jgi:hypothetical protein
VSQTTSKKAQQLPEGKPRSSANAPRMEKMREEYKKKNRTTMYGRFAPVGAALGA